jgi:Pyruvate/2-oxoacid:ferredoxin oxidoreductase gamma subunit
MIGCLAAVSGLLRKQSYRDSIAESVPKAAIDLNLRAFEVGYEYGANAERILPESLESTFAVITED